MKKKMIRYGSCVYDGACVIYLYILLEYIPVSATLYTYNIFIFGQIAGCFMRRKVVRRGMC